jgi:hypothetical protein
MTNLVETALQGMPPARRAPSASVPSEVPVRPPRERSLVKSLLQGDAMKADVRRFFRVRSTGIPVDWDPDSVVAVEQILSRDPGTRPGGFLGLLRFACDLREQEVGQSTWSEAHLWSLVRRRLSSSSGLMLLRSVANAHEILQALVEDPDPQRRRAFADLLRVLGARIGKPFLEHPKIIDRPVWEFALVLSLRADQYNTEFRGTGARPIRCLDLLFGTTSLYLRERGAEPTLSDLRSATLQTGAPLGPALDSWVRGLAGLSGQSLFPGLEPQEDPRDWVWETGRSLLDRDGLLDRTGRLAACERALLERARAQESWKEEVALAVHEEFRKEIDRVLPESRRLSHIPPIPAVPQTSPVSEPVDAFDPLGFEPIAQNSRPSPVPAEPVGVQAAMAAFGQKVFPGETVDGLPTVGFGMLDLERQGRWIAEGWRTGWTPTGHVWADHFRSLLGDARVREFLRMDADWIGGLREILTEPDPWLMAGWEDLVRWLYPSRGRMEPVEFRQNQRPGAPAHHTGWDWTVLRLFALTLAEVASAVREPGLAPSCLVVVLRWQILSHRTDLPPHSASWWQWLSEEVEVRSEQEGNRRFPAIGPMDDDWRMRNIAPWIAFPSTASATILGEWVTDPVAAIQADPHPIHERWASRLSMLTQLQEEAKEDALAELAKKI